MRVSNHRRERYPGTCFLTVEASLLLYSFDPSFAFVISRAIGDHCGFYPQQDCIQQRKMGARTSSNVVDYSINWNTSFTDIQPYITCYDFPVCEVPLYGVSILGDNQTPSCAQQAELFYPCTCNILEQRTGNWTIAFMYKSIVYCNGRINVFEMATLSASWVMFLASCALADR